MLESHHMSVYTLPLSRLKNYGFKKSHLYLVNDEIKGVTVSQPTVLDLGPNNIGSLGADSLPANNNNFRVAYEDPDYRLQNLLDVYVCMDGRFDPNNFAQVLGGIAIFDTYIDVMMRAHNTSHPAEKVSNVLVANVKDAIEDGFEVTVHGDQAKGKEGCAANLVMQDLLRFQSENIDIIAPLAWTVAEQLGVTQQLAREDTTRMALNGKESADNEELWDVTAVERVDLIVANGGRYIELQGSHGEVDGDIEMDPNAKVDTAKFGNAFKNEAGDPAQLFIFTLGKYAEDTYARAEARGWNKQEASLRILAGISLHLTAFKMLGNKDMGVTLAGQSSLAAK